jgi:GT2 family glycosyltransferase
MNDRCITIVIPVFNNWQVVEPCIASCKKYIDPRHTVLIVDDCSTEEGLGEKIQDAIQDAPNFRYERNSKNLGFVGTCNKAVLKLDTTTNDILLLNSDTELTEGAVEEMIACLYSHERHGACSPRSNASTLCTIPLRYTGEKNGFEEVSFSCWQKMQNILPRYATIPTGVGFCLLIRRALIERFGLFDTAYGRGYNEENDFCSRINRYGYSAIMANRAYVFHKDTSSFSAVERALLDSRNSVILQKRYPEYKVSVQKYFGNQLPAMEHFADILGECYSKKKILFDLSHLPAAYNGSSEYALHLLEHLAPLLEEKYKLYIVVSRPLDLLFGISRKYKNVLFYEEIQDKRYDLVFVPHQIFGIGHLSMLNNVSPRWVVTMHDIISLRCNKLHSLDTEQAAKLTAKYGNGLICISNAAKEDMTEYLGNEIRASSTVIYHGYAQKQTTEAKQATAPFNDDFFLLVGNHFPHKAVSATLDALSPELNIVVLGGKKQRSLNRPNTHVIISGQTEEAEVSALYANCVGIIFPSQYEGFGLPLLHAGKYGKPIVVCDTASNKEISHAFNLSKYVRYFSHFSEINTLCNTILSAQKDIPPADTLLRTWKNVATDTALFIGEILHKQIDVPHLTKRYSLLKELERKQHEAEFYKRSLLMKSLQKVSSRVGKQLQPYPRAKKRLRSAAKAMRLNL